MIDQGKKINSWGKNVYVKVPVVNSKNNFTGKVIKELNNSSIKLNITAVYTAKQTEKILKVINKKNKSYYIYFCRKSRGYWKRSSPRICKKH
jgi:transaldolase